MLRTTLDEETRGALATTTGLWIVLEQGCEVRLGPSLDNVTTSTGGFRCGMHGIDIGSNNKKVLCKDPRTTFILWLSYNRHNRLLQ